MPSVFTHGLIGYILFGYKGLLLSIIPDIIGFGYYFYRMFFIHKTIDFKKPFHTWAPIDKMNDVDWGLYNISHSLILWGFILFIFKEKYIYAAIISIIVDILLHSKDKWLGPAFLYPISDYRFDGVHWLTNKGKIFTLIIVLITYFQKQKILKFLN